MGVFSKIKGNHCKTIGIHLFLILVFLLGPIVIYFNWTESILSWINEYLGTPHRDIRVSISTMLPFIFLIFTALLFTIINTLYAYDNNNTEDKLIKWTLRAFFFGTLVIAVVYCYEIFQISYTIKDIENPNWISQETKEDISVFFKVSVDLVFYYTLGIGFLFIVMDLRAKYVCKTINDELVEFAKNQFMLIDLPLLISAILTYILTFKLKIIADWNDYVYSYFSIGLLVMQLIFSQIVFFFLKSKYVLENE